MTAWSIQSFIAMHEAGTNPKDPRGDIDFASLCARYPEFADIGVEDGHVSGPHGEIPVRTYRPAVPSSSGLLWMHGGGFIGGDLDMPEANWTSLALAACGITVVSVDYRKALHGVTYPIPSDDILAAWKWASDELRAGGIDRLHLGGASAGGNLAAGVAKRLRDDNSALPASVLLIYPTLHFDLLPPSAEGASALARLNPVARFPADDMHAMNMQFIGRSTLRNDQYAFAGNGDVSGLPPILVVASEADDLRSSGEEFVRQVVAVGGTACLEVEPNSTHGHLDQPYEPQGARTIAKMVDWLAARPSA